MKPLKNILILYILISISFILSAQSKKPSIVNFHSVGDSKEISDIRDIIESFEKENPDIKVNLVQLRYSSDILSEYYRNLIKKFPSKIDVIAVESSWAPSLQNSLLDLSSYFANSLLKKHYKKIVKCYDVDDKLIAVPWYCDVPLIYYRKDLLEKYNISPPQTWAELAKSAREILAKEKNPKLSGYIWQGFAYEGLTCNALEWIYGNDGGVLINRYREVTLVNQNSVKALDIAKSWIGSISPKEVLTMDDPITIKIFIDANAVFARIWSSAYNICYSSRSKIDKRFGVVPMPKGKMGRHVGILSGWGLGIVNSSTNINASVKLINYLISEKNQRYRALSSGDPPTLKSFYKQLKHGSKFLAVKVAIEDSFRRPVANSYPHYSDISRDLYLNVYKVLCGKLTPKEALNLAADEISDIDGFSRTD